MAPEPTWQPNYVDLSDDRSIRLGAQCLICGARFESPLARLDLDPAFGFAIQGSLDQEVAELKYRTFVEFDAAYRELSFDCPRCHRSACVDCWDADHRMCGACVAAGGLKRSPHRGIAADGPLADGRLRCVEHGQFADAAQPSWLDALLSAEPQHSGDLPPSVTDTSWMRQVRGAAPAGRGDPFAGNGPSGQLFSMSLHQTGTLAYEPTAKLASLPDYAPRQAPVSFDAPGSLTTLSSDHDPYDTPEGKVTSTKVKCPRCGAANYDFVTNCTTCQLQLIQNCPMCGKLNPGHAHECEFCGSSLDRPRGWAAIEDAVQPLNHQEARKASAPRSSSAKRWRTAKHKAHNANTATNGNATSDANFANNGNNASQIQVVSTRPEPFTIDPSTGALAVPSFLPASYFETSAVREELYEPGFGERLLYAFERVITVAFWLILLTLVVGITAAEVSPHANAAIRGATQIDIRLTLAHFGSWAHRMMNHKLK